MTFCTSRVHLAAYMFSDAIFSPADFLSYRPSLYQTSLHLYEHSMLHVISPNREYQYVLADSTSPEVASTPGGGHSLEVGPDQALSQCIEQWKLIMFPPTLAGYDARMRLEAMLLSIHQTRDVAEKLLVAIGNLLPKLPGIKQIV